MRYSMKRQFAFIFISLMMGTILLCWFLNNTLLEKYYFENKKEIIYQAYNTIEGSVEKGKLYSSDFISELYQICEKYNISIMMMNVDSQIPICVGSEKEVMQQALFDNIFGRLKEKENIKVFRGDEGAYYVLQKVFDTRTNMNFLEMWGAFASGDFFMIRSSVESIRESVAISNRFLAYIGLFAALASGVIIWFVSNKVTKPILELTDISKRMNNLEFDAKYSGKSRTEVAMLGENINQLSSTLEKTISELKTANNELLKDIERKNQIDEMRKDFLSNVSHELKTPIALIQGYAEGLREGILEDDESKEFYCEVIMDEASKMNHLVKRLLTLNELEFGKDNITMERFDIVNLIQNYIQSARILLEQNQVVIKMKDYSPIYVWADEIKTEEVFANYLTNAVNHAKREKVIEIALTYHANIVRVSVVNTGDPIPKDSLNLIWDKFYKVDKARTREYGGSGVGLSIVKAIMTSMNQKFGVINYENGVEFWFELDSADAGGNNNSNVR